MEERQLIQRILLHGDTRCYEEIVCRYSGAIYSKVTGIIHDADLAKDLTQQTFIRAYSRLESWKGQSLGAWLNTIAVHLSLNEIDKRRRHRAVPLDGQECTEQPPEYSEEHEALLQQLDKAIQGLQPRDQAIIRLHYFNNQKAEEIAHQLNMTSANVLVKLHRIREQLKKNIENERARV